MKLSEYPNIMTKASNRYVKAQILHDLLAAPVVIAADDGRLAATFAPATPGHKAVCDHLTSEVQALDTELAKHGFEIDLPVDHNARLDEASDDVDDE